MEQIKSYIESLGLNLGCIDKDIKNLSQSNINKIIKEFYGDSTDIKIKHKRKDYYIEIMVVDNEVDIYLLTNKEYINRYGEDEEE